MGLEFDKKKNRAVALEKGEAVEIVVDSEEDKLEELEMEAKGRQIFDPVERKYDERKKRVTDLRECSRITLPKPLPPTEEAKIEIRREIHKNIYEKYREENCSKKGEQRSNLTKEEQEGLKSLEKKVKERKQRRSKKEKEMDAKRRGITHKKKVI